MTPQEIAERINAVRAERGEPPINARVEGGVIVSDPVRATPLSPAELRALKRSKAPPPNHKPGVNRGVAGKIMQALAGARSALLVSEVADLVGSDKNFVRSRLQKLMTEGLVEHGPPRRMRQGPSPAVTYVRTRKGRRQSERAASARGKGDRPPAGADAQSASNGAEGLEGKNR